MFLALTWWRMRGRWSGGGVGVLWDVRVLRVEARVVRVNAAGALVTLLVAAAFLVGEGLGSERFGVLAFALGLALGLGERPLLLVVGWADGGGGEVESRCSASGLGSLFSRPSSCKSISSFFAGFSSSASFVWVLGS